jgi:hypothetical protein
MLHRIAKQFIADRKFIHYPELIAIHPAKGPIRVAPRDQLWAVTVQTEPTHIEGLRPDALLITKSGRQLAVEVNVTNPKDAETAAKYAAAGLDCIEIDAIGYRDSLDAEELPRIIIEIATRRWIYSARIATAEAEFAEEHRRQQAQKLAIERAEQLARDEAERQRQAAARAHAEQQRRLAEAAREQAKRRAHAEAADLNAKLQAAKDADARQRVHAFKLDLAAYAYDRLGNQRGYDWLRQPTLTLPGYSVLDWPEWDTPTEADFQSIRMEIDALACHCLAL